MIPSNGLAQVAPPAPDFCRRVLRGLRNLTVFGAIFAATCALLGALAPFPEVPGIYPKWAWFKKKRDQFDVLFLGSSRFYHQIIPPQFDAAVSSAPGAPVRSFNFGYDGMWPPESYFVLRKILALRPARLKWVIVDLMDLNTELEDRNSSTLRMAYWHDARHTRLAFADILAKHRAWPETADLLAAHARLWWREALNLGRGADLLQARLAPRSPRKKPYAWEERAGYEPGADRPISPEMEKLLQQGIARVRKQWAPAPVRPVFRDALSEVIAEVRAAGAEPIFVLPPTIDPAENFTELPDGVTVWRFNNPAEYPALFDPAQHYDPWHLNHAGAVEFTALLAARFAAHRRAAP